MKYLLRIVATTSLLPTLISCAASDRESRGKLFCNVNRTGVYQIGSDPANDFNETNLRMDTTFNNVTCPDVNNESFQVFVSRAKRVGNQLTVIQNQFNSAQFQLDFEISGNNINPIDNSLTINSCTIKRLWSGTIDSPATTITIVEDIDYKGNCAPVFLDQNQD